MTLNYQDKQAVVVELKKITENALSILLIDFCGLIVNKMTEIRKKSRQADIYVKVVRNTLLRRSVEDTSFECLKKNLVGQTLFVCSMKHPGSAARLFNNFIKKSNIKIKIKAIAFQGKLIPVSQIDSLANIPTHEEAIISLISILKEVSTNRLIRLLVKVSNKESFRL